MWPSKIANILRLLIFNQLMPLKAGTCMFGTSSEQCWGYTYMVLDKDGKWDDRAVDFYQLIRHVLRMPNHRLLRWVMFTGVGLGYKKAIGTQNNTKNHSMKLLTTELSRVCRFKLRGSNLLNYHGQMVKALNDMIQDWSQWRIYIHSLSSNTCTFYFGNSFFLLQSY